MGGFVISCVGDDFDLAEVLRLGDDYVLAAQGYFFGVGRDELVSKLAQGRAPEEALSSALSPELDPPGQSSGPTYRQYAALTIDGSVAQHSGRDLSPFAGHQTGSLGSLTYALQGNILTGSFVLDQLKNGFLTPRATIAERSVSALRSLADSGGGDSRCSPLSGDAGYFIWRGAGASPLEIGARSLPEGEEVARVLALSIETRVAELPSEATDPQEEPKARPQAESSGGCLYSRGRSISAALLIGVVGFLLLARRRTTWKRS